MTRTSELVYYFVSVITTKKIEEKKKPPLILNTQTKPNQPKPTSKMRFSAIFLTGALAAFATAETTTSALSPQTSAQVAIVKCLEACPLGDVDCQSKCISVPNPDASMVCTLQFLVWSDITSHCIVDVNP